MMIDKFNEDTRVKFPATIHFLRLGYLYRSYNKSLSDGLIDFNTKIFKDSFAKAICKINNKQFSVEEIESLISKIHASISNIDMGKDFYNWLINPVDKPKLIDFDNIENNIFEVVNELKFGEQDEGHFRPDINVLINGIPLAFLEVKKPNNDGGIQVEFDRMINDRYKKVEHRKYFNMIQLTCFSNNMPYESDEDREAEPKQGSFYSTPNGTQTTFNFFREESKIKIDLKEDNDETIADLLKDNNYSPAVMETSEYLTNIAENTPCNSFITSLFQKKRLMFLLQYGIIYDEETTLEKHIMRYPQFFASQAILKRIEKGGKSGIIWHTQGSGKTELAVYANRILRDYYAKLRINTRFFYVVDRLELLNQTKAEFEKRGVEAIGVDDKQSFIDELQRTLDKKENQKAFGACCIVNIQKFSDSLPEIKNDYNAKVMRIFFIDEAHRSYSKGTGEFYKNLMLVDRDAIFIAMTGTPLLSKKERSNLRFGDYIHKYFYDRSILDGYTLKIKKEEMETVAKAEIKRNLELEFKGKSGKEKAKILESDEYITALGKYIYDDFRNFRYVNGDKSIGGMIVCNSNKQAALMQEWFERYCKDLPDVERINTRLVTDEVPSAVNKETQEDFKKAKNGIDILIVNMMCTTGYDVRRLKKMYLLRIPREHSLLQTISRVNRPYKNPEGKVYQYGYISDFVDITEEYDRTVAQYLKELNEELLDPDDPNYQPTNPLVFNVEEIKKKYQDNVEKLDDTYEHDNLEEYDKFLQRINDKDPLFTLRKIINTILDCRTEFMLSRADDLANAIDRKHYKELAKLVQHRIDFLNIASDPLMTMSFLSEKEVVELLFKFVKVNTVVLDMNVKGKTPKPGLERLAKAIKGLKNHDDEEVMRLDEFLRKAFEKLSINNDADLSDEIKHAIETAERINKENEELAARFNGEFAYVKTYQDLAKNHPNFKKDDLLKFMEIISKAVSEIKSINNLVLLGRTNFINNIKTKTTADLLKEGLYSKLNLNDLFNIVLSNLFVNLQLY